MNLKIVPVENRRDWNLFFELRRKLYQGDPNAVFPLNFMERLQLDPAKHPFYEHADSQAFVCLKNDHSVGRIVAIKDHLHNQHHGDQVGFFGFYESVNDAEVSAALIETASNWLRENGCESIRGPVNPSMKGEFGVVVKGNDDPPFVMMSYSPTYYEKLLTDCGLKTIREFYAYLYDIPSQYQQVQETKSDLLAATAKVLKRYPKLRIGNVNQKSIEKELKAINQLANKVRSTGWGFVPLTESELDFMVNQLKRVLDPTMLLVAYWEDKLVGYCINVPCINWALRKTLGKADWIRLPQFLYWLRRTQRSRVIGLGADENYRKRGVGVLLSAEMKTRGIRDLQYQQWEFSWVDSQNFASIRAIERTMPLVHYKTIRLYQKDIETNQPTNS